VERPIHTKKLKPQSTAAIRVTTEPARIGEAFREVLPEVGSHLEAAGVSPAGPPFARFFDYTEDEADFETGFPVPEPVEGEGRVIAGELPGGLAAVTTHVGPYEGLQDVHAAIGEWVLAHGHDPGGAVWEVYETSPADEEDSSRWRTEVVWPLRK
jgi:effector-binding domain-containing protein